MLRQLVESSPRRVRRRFSTLVSLVAHALVLSAAVVAARPVPEEPRVDTVIPWDLPPHPPAPPTAPQCSGCKSGSAPGTQIPIDRLPCSSPDCLGFTLDVPDSVALPSGDIRISRDEWERGTRAGGSGDTASVLAREGVDKEVVPLPTNRAPEYPAMLRAARIEGSVLARFIVDTTGRVLTGSVVIDRADHPLFADAVVESLKRARYAPAELGGRKVRQLVAQPFAFVIRH